MTPRQIILANLEHGAPSRIGMNFSGKRWNDFAWGGLGPSPRFTQKQWVEGEFEYSDDEWGNIWFRIVGKSQSGEVFRPAITDWGQLGQLTLPDYDNPDRYEGIRAAFRQPTDQFRCAFMPGWIFATSRYLRKMEIYFTDLYEHPEEINLLHRRVTDLFVTVIRNYALAGADGIMYCEDLGLQHSLLLSPKMWRELFRPHYERLCATAHEHGMKVLMHSCGFVWPLIDDLVNAGVDCFQFDQPAAYDMPALAAKLKQRRVGLWSPVDIQQVMPTGNRELIESEAAKLVNTFRGFFIAKNYPDLHGIGVQPEWDQWAYEAICRAAGLPPVPPAG